MNFLNMLAMAAPAAGAEGQSAPNPWIGLLPFIIIIGAMMFMTVRSQKKQRQRREEMMSKIVKGSKVLLANGILGTITEVKDKTYMVEIADKVNVNVVQTSIVEILPEDSASGIAAK